MSVPLVNNNSVESINTSIIAIKKELTKNANGTESLKNVDVNVDVNIAHNSLYCAASSTIIKGAPIFQGCSIKVMFTSAITGSNTTSPLTINYNNVDITVKVGKNGTLADFVAYNTGSGYIYCQAYTTLELLFDGNNFIIMGNPAVISNSDYTVYTDGSITYNKNYINGNTAIKVNTRDLDTLLQNYPNQSIYVLDRSSPQNFTGLPTISDYSDLGDGVGIQLQQMKTDDRGVQVLYMQYYTTLGDWINKIYTRKVVSNVIFGWHLLQEYYG